jgi:hypothetical protein
VKTPGAVAKMTIVPGVGRSTAASNASLLKTPEDTWRLTGNDETRHVPAANARHLQPQHPALLYRTITPAVRELTQLLDRSSARGSCMHLNIVEQMLLMQEGSFELIPDTLLKTAYQQLQALIRRFAPLPASARILDAFEHALADADIRCFAIGHARTQWSRRLPRRPPANPTSDVPIEQPQGEHHDPS